MNIDEMREFVVFSKNMNFTKTAQELCLSQSTLSTHIMKMEKELGVDLLDRTKSRIYLTSAGCRFLEMSLRVINEYNSALVDCKKLAKWDKGHIVVQVLQHADRASQILMRRALDFAKENPGITVEIEESLCPSAPENIRKGIIDCGFYGLGFHDKAIEEDLQFVPMADERLVVWLDRDSSLLDLDSFTLHDLKAFEIPTWVGLGSTGFDKLYDELFESYQAEINYSPRYCISREDFFLNRVNERDTVILTEGSEAISAIKVRDERVFKSFNPPIFAKSFVAFRVESEIGEAERMFRDYLLRQYELDPHAEGVEK